MKIFSPLLTALIIFTTTVKSQFVTISDPVVRNAMAAKCPSAFSGNQLDTTNACILSVADITITGGTDFNGLQYFKALTYLSVMNPDEYATFPVLPSTLNSISLINNLRNLPDLRHLPSLNTFQVINCKEDTIRNLPNAFVDYSISGDSIQHIDTLPVLCTSMYLGCPLLSYLPALPSNLQILGLTKSSLSSVPPLPSSLQELIITECPLNTLPALPNSLYKLQLGNNFDSTFTATLPAALPPNLGLLSCSNMNIPSLPNLPASLYHLTINKCGLSVMPTLPSGLTTLSLVYNPILPLMTTLPPALKSFWCYNNDWVSLPSPLPSTITTLFCGNNLLTSLPNLPDSLEILGCEKNQISVLPPLPPKISQLTAQYNSLIQLPVLPDSLSYLDVSYNQLTSLGSFPARLETLIANNNNLTTIESLPARVNNANLRYNDLVTLPGFNQPQTSLVLNVRDNPLNCLPYLPNKITMDVRFTNVTCIPNKPPISTFNPPTIGLCDTANTICPLYPKLSGNFYYDANQNGIKDASEQPLPFVTFSIDSGYYYNASDSAGNFFTSEIDTGIHIINILNSYFTVTNPVAPFHLSYNMTLNIGAIGIYYTPGITDMQSFLTGGIYPPNPGFLTDFYLTYHNNGTSTCNPLVTFTFDTLLQNVTAVPFPDSVVNNMAYWNMPVMNPSEIETIEINGLTNVNASINDLMISVSSANCIGIDNTPADNNFTLAQYVVGSFDPNSKAANVDEIVYGNGSNPAYVTYTVNFQNTGNYPAAFVVIIDTIDPKLDLSSFMILHASHAYTYEINNRVLKVTFSNINLPDSTSNEPESHGLVSYAIKPLSGLSIGDHILNTAYIYFDFNTPIITNTVDLPLVLTPTAITDLGEQNDVSIYPNPSSNFFRIKSSDKIKVVSVFDLYGRKMEEKNFTENLGQVQINCGNWEKGMYLIEISLINKAKIKRKLLLR